MNNTNLYKLSIPIELCTPEMMDELKAKGYTEIQDESNFTGKQFRNFICASVGFLGGCITIVDKFLPAEVNQIVIVVDGVHYQDLTKEKVNDIIDMAMKDQNQVAFFPNQLSHEPLLATEFKKE